MSFDEIGNPSTLLQFSLGLNGTLNVATCDEGINKNPLCSKETFKCKTCCKNFLSKSSLKYHHKTHW